MLADCIVYHSSHRDVSRTHRAASTKTGRYLDTENDSNGLFGDNNIVTKTQLVNEFRPYYEVNADHMIWYDFAS